MADREKLELEYNIPCEIKLLYDTPQTGESDKGPWQRYTVEVDDEEMSWFAHRDAHGKIQKLGAGKDDVLLVIRRQEKGEDKKKHDMYEIEMMGGEGQSSPGLPPKENSEGNATEGTTEVEIGAQMLYAMQYAARIASVLSGESCEDLNSEHVLSMGFRIFDEANTRGVRLHAPKKKD